MTEVTERVAKKVVPTERISTKSPSKTCEKTPLTVFTMTSSAPLRMVLRKLLMRVLIVEEIVMEIRKELLEDILSSSARKLGRMIETTRMTA